VSALLRARVASQSLGSVLLGWCDVHRPTEVKRSCAIGSAAEERNYRQRGGNKSAGKSEREEMTNELVSITFLCLRERDRVT
jgi:hypothetical protein